MSESVVYDFGVNFVCYSEETNWSPVAELFFWFFFQEESNYASSPVIRDFAVPECCIDCCS